MQKLGLYIFLLLTIASIAFAPEPTESSGENDKKVGEKPAAQGWGWGLPSLSGTITAVTAKGTQLAKAGAEVAGTALSNGLAYAPSAKEVKEAVVQTAGKAATTLSDVAAATPAVLGAATTYVENVAGIGSRNK